VNSTREDLNQLEYFSEDTFYLYRFQESSASSRYLSSTN